MDILNCEFGCNHGTGTDHDVDIDDIDAAINKLKKKAKEEKTVQTGRFGKKTTSYSIADWCNANLKLEDFLRSYTNRSADVGTLKVASNDLEKTYKQLHKKIRRICAILIAQPVL